jgi:anti-sigma B factor antagonist
MPDLRLSSRAMANGCFYIEAQGFLDAHTYEDMDRLIQNIFARNCYRLIIKLERVDYISSAGAGVFVGAIGESQQAGGNLVFLNPSSNVREVFDLLGLSQIFLFADSLEQAVRSF